MTTSTGGRSRHAAAIDAQVAYYTGRKPTTILPTDSPYAHRHYRELMAVANLDPGQSVCEWGSGLGRFSRLLAADGFTVDAIELSPSLADESREALAGAGKVTVHCGDILSLLETGLGPFDAVVGFFVLHHLPELLPYLRAAHRVLRPGGRIVFVEPNPFHPLYPVQIGLTPGMRWHAERGIYRLTPGALRRAAREAGFSQLSLGRYGALPRAPYNLVARWGVERAIEALVPRVVRPFQTIVGSR